VLADQVVADREGVLAPLRQVRSGGTAGPEPAPAVLGWRHAGHRLPEAREPVLPGGGGGADGVEHQPPAPVPRTCTWVTDRPDATTSASTRMWSPRAAVATNWVDDQSAGRPVADSPTASAAASAAPP
jgi:hypothetical protein